MEVIYCILGGLFGITIGLLSGYLMWIYPMKKLDEVRKILNR